LTLQRTASAKHHGLLEELDDMVKTVTSHVLEAGQKGLEPGEDFMAITETLDGLNAEMQGLDQFFKEKSTSLAKYDVERMQKAVSEVRTEYLKLQDALQPKKKFGFRSKSKTTVAATAAPTKPKEDEKAKPAAAAATQDESSYKVTNAEGKAEVVVLKATSLNVTSAWINYVIASSKSMEFRRLCTPPT